MAIREEKEIKGIQIGKKRTKTIIVYKCIYIENPKDCTRKLLECIEEFSEVSGYKINTQKFLAFLYTNNRRSEREIKKTIPFTIASKRLKYLGINLPKQEKYLYSENYKTLMKETDRYTQIDIQCSLIGRNNTVKITTLLKAIYRLSANPIKLPMAFFTELEQRKLNFYINTKNTK